MQNNKDGLKIISFSHNFCNQQIFAMEQFDVLLQVALFNKSVMTDIKSSFAMVSSLMPSHVA